MTEQNVLVVAYYFPPMGLSGVQRTATFVKYLPEFGWHPHVVTTGPVGYYAHDEMLLHDLEQREIPIDRVGGKDPNALLASQGTVKMPREWVRKLLSRISNTFFIPDNKKSWSKCALAHARELVTQKHFEAIFVSGPPFSSFQAAATLSRETGIPLIVDYRDLWHGNQFHFYPTPWHAHKHKRLEHAVLTMASKVVVTNRRMKERIVEKYPHVPFRDIVIIPQGYDPADLQTQRTLFSDARPAAGAAMKLSYTGIFYDFVTPRHFFAGVATALKQRQDMKLELHFAGILREEHARYAKRLGLAEIIVDHGYLSHPETVRLELESDALWMMVGNCRNVDTISSGKLYEYIGTGKPLLVSVPEGALRQDAQRYSAAWITNPDDVSAIAECIIEMYDAWRAGRLPVPDDAEVTRYDRRDLTEQLAWTLSHSGTVI
jgi:glycosyltransferase involved in cell wall biosynthesis